jgi:hypothetical protein
MRQRALHERERETFRSYLLRSGRLCVQIDEAAIGTASPKSRESEMLSLRSRSSIASPCDDDA